MIDTTIVRAHQHSTGDKKAPDSNEAIGRSRVELSTKINATCDALSNPTSFHLTAGQTHNLDRADVLLPQLEAGALLADRAYNADE